MAVESAFGKKIWKYLHHHMVSLNLMLIIMDITAAFCCNKIHYLSVMNSCFATGQYVCLFKQKN